MSEWPRLVRWLHFFSKSEWVNVFLTAVIAATGIVGVILVIQSGDDTQKMIRAAQQQATAATDQADAAQQFSDTAEDINGRMSDAVDQLGAAASNAKAGITATQEAMRQEQRAWIGMMQITGIPEVGKPFHATAVFQNTGRTPATDFVSQERMLPLVSGQRFAANWHGNAPNIQSHALLFPNQLFSAVVKASEKDVAVDQPTLDSVINTGSVVIYVFGRACYKDVFKKRHWIRFCEVYDPGGKDWVSCAEYNEIDTERTASEETCTMITPN